MDKYFEISKRNSTIRKEIFAGITTFFAMAYIVFVAPNQIVADGKNGWIVSAGLADANTVSKIWNSVFIASILVAVVGTLAMAFIAKMPLATACGMGLNSFFCSVFIAGAANNGENLVTGYQTGLVVIFLSGIVLVVITVTGLRQKIARTLPDSLKKSVSAGIGLFIAFVGLKNAGIVEKNEHTFVQIFDFHGRLSSANLSGIEAWRACVPPIVAIIGVVVIVVLNHKKNNASVIFGILISTILYWLLMWQVPDFSLSGIGQPFKDFAEIGLGGLFNKDAWSMAWGDSFIGGAFSCVMLIIVFCLVEVFDAIGALYGTCSTAGLMDENGDPIKMNESMLCESVGSIASSILGTSSCATFVESASGIGAGGRTGLSSLVTAGCFMLCLFMSPLAGIVPSSATAPALIYVGTLMAKNFANIDMSDMKQAVPAFLTFILMPLTYSITNGLGVGTIAYVLIAIFTGSFKKKDILIAVIAVLFVMKFITVTM